MHSYSSGFYTSYKVFQTGESKRYSQFVFFKVCSASVLATILFCITMRLVFLCSIKFYETVLWVGLEIWWNSTWKKSYSAQDWTLQVLCGLLLLLTHSLWWLPIFTWDNTIKTTSNCESKELSTECEYVGRERESTSTGLLPSHQ